MSLFVIRITNDHFPSGCFIRNGGNAFRIFLLDGSKTITEVFVGIITIRNLWLMFNMLESLGTVQDCIRLVKNVLNKVMCSMEINAKLLELRRFY